MSTQIIRPARSMSYNDIKKRRFLRESKSKNKLKYNQINNQVVNTQKKAHYNKNGILIKNQNTKQTKALKQLIVVKIPNNQAVQDTVKKVNKIPKTNIGEKNEVIEITTNQRETNQSDCVSPKKIVKELIEDAKSQRKLLKYNEVRNKFKSSKSKSKSKSSKSLLQHSKLLLDRSFNMKATPQKPQQRKPMEPSNQNYRIKKFENILQHQPSMKPSYRYLVANPHKNNDLLQKNRQIEKRDSIKQIIGLDATQSSIQIQKQNSQQDEQQNIIFQQMFEQKKTYYQDKKQCNLLQEQKILDLLTMQKSQLYKYLGKKQRQKKLINDLEKLNKKFPKGFFNF